MKIWLYNNVNIITCKPFAKTLRKLYVGDDIIERIEQYNENNNSIINTKIKNKYLIGMTDTGLLECHYIEELKIYDESKITAYGMFKISESYILSYGTYYRK